MYICSAIQKNAVLLDDSVAYNPLKHTYYESVTKDYCTYCAEGFTLIPTDQKTLCV